MRTRTWFWPVRPRMMSMWMSFPSIITPLLWLFACWTISVWPVHLATGLSWVSFIWLSLRLWIWRFFLPFCVWFMTFLYITTFNVFNLNTIDMLIKLSVGTSSDFKFFPLMTSRRIPFRWIFFNFKLLIFQSLLCSTDTIMGWCLCTWSWGCFVNIYRLHYALRFRTTALLLGWLLEVLVDHYWVNDWVDVGIIELQLVLIE